MSNRNPGLIREGPYHPERDEESALDARRGARAPLSELPPWGGLSLYSIDAFFRIYVGNTALTRARNLERELGLSEIYLKYEAGNPTGTHKDRIACLHVIDALAQSFSAVTVATCGNYGAAVAKACEVAGLGCVIYLPKTYRTRRRGEMLRAGARIIEVTADYETALSLSRAAAQEQGMYDANPGEDNSSFQQRAYEFIAREINDALGDAPSLVAVPVANGTTLAGVYRGFVNLVNEGSANTVPIFVAGSSGGKNPIVHSYRKRLALCAELNPCEIRETRTNEPLVGWRAADGDAALQTLYENDGFAGGASDRSLLAHAKLLRELEGMSVLPASTAGMAVFLDLHRKKPFPQGKYVMLLTGRKV